MPEGERPGAPTPGAPTPQAEHPAIDPAKVRNWILLVILCTGVIWSVIEFGMGHLLRPTSVRLQDVEEYIEAEGDLPQQFQNFQMEQTQMWERQEMEGALKDSTSLMRREQHDENVLDLKAMICHIDPQAPGCGGSE